MKLHTITRGHIGSDYLYGRRANAFVSVNYSCWSIYFHHIYVGKQFSFVWIIDTDIICLVCYLGRYFTCTPLHGLFAPVSKVTAAPARDSTRSAAAAASQCRQVMQTSTSVRRPSRHVPTSSSAAQLMERTGSRESISSMSSVTSSASRSRVRLGVSAVCKQVVVC